MTSNSQKLSIRPGDDGRILVKCFGDCQFSDICAGLGVEAKDLFPETLQNADAGKHHNGTAKVHASQAAAIQSLQRGIERNGNKTTHAATWDYSDASGSIVAAVVRFDLGGSDKTYRNMRRVPGGWENKQISPRPLYRLPEVVEADAVWLFEGEKCADAASELGIVATTTMGGSKQAKKTDFGPLDGKSVVLCPDSGDDGDTWTSDIAKSLSALPNPPTVQLCPLGFSERNLDVVDWLEGQSSDDPAELREKLQSLCEPLGVERDDEPTESDPRRPVTYRVFTSDELASTQFVTEYLVKGTLVKGEPCIIGGSKKTLKTSVMIDLAVSLAIGGCFLGHRRVNRPARVLVMSGESGLATLKETANRICKAAGVSLASLKGTLCWSEDLPKFGDLRHMDALGDLLTSLEIDVLELDPAYLCMPSSDASNLLAQGELLKSMNDVCRRANAQLILAHHTKKHSGGDKGARWEPPELEDIAWAGFQEWARQWLLLGRRQKYQPGSHLHEMWLNIGGSAGHSSLWAVDVDESGTVIAGTDPDDPANRERGWDVTVRTASEAKEEAKRRAEAAKADTQRQRQDEMDERALTALRANPEGLTKTNIRDLARVQSKDIDAVLERLHASGKIAPATITRGNEVSYSGWRAVGFD